VDGTLINALPKMTWALWKKDQNAIKAHTQFDLQKYVPVKITKFIRDVYLFNLLGTFTYLRQYCFIVFLYSWKIAAVLRASQ